MSKIFLSYSQLYGKSMEANDLQGVAIFGPRGMVGMLRAIHPKGCDKFAPKRLDWQDLCRVPLNIGIHTKHISCGPHGFREYFYWFFHYKSMGVVDPHGVASLDPRGLIGRICVVDP